MNETFAKRFGGLTKQVKLEALRRRLEEGIASLDNGEGSPLDMKAIKAKARVIKERRHSYMRSSSL